MNYSIIKVWEIYQMDSEFKFYEKHIGYFLTKEDASKAAGTHYEIEPREAIKVGDDIFLLANGVGYNKPIVIGK